MRRLTSEKPVRWLMVTRVAVTATLLIAAYAIEIVLAPSEPLAPLFMLCAGSFAMILGYAVAYRFWPRSQGLIAVQIAGDLLIVTGFVWLTGGVASPMSFLYLIPIVTASLLLLRRGAVATAAGASALYAWLALAGRLHLFPIYPRSVELSAEIDQRRLLYSLLSHALGFFLTALFSSYLSEKLRATGLELAEKQSDLDELRALNENIVESINSGLVTTDATGRITFVNPGACDILRCRRQDLVGRVVTELFGLDRSYLARIAETLESDRRVRIERPFRTPDGLDRFLGLAVSILRDREHRSLGYIFTFQDLTEINALERQIRFRERMAALGEMAAGMAHELRNPLASISGSVQVLKTELKLQGEQLELMDIILRESQRLDQTIRDFLQFARPARFAPEEADLVALVDQSAKLLRNSREFGPGHAIVILPDTAEILCEIDVNRMKQVFWNLATNALKAMPDGGTLEIRITHARQAIEITFADEGIGMRDEDVERYFQPFHTQFAQGTGLGAAIVYRIVEEHGGSVRLTSRPGQGTQVSMTLPATAAGRVETSAAAGFAAGVH